MKTNIRIILFFVLSGICLSQNTQGYLPKDTADHIIRLTYNRQFDEAIELVEKKKLDNPTSLQWKYFHAMILFRMSNYLSYQKSIGYTKDQNQIFRLNKNAFDEFTEITQIGDKVIEKNPKDTVTLFYSGAAYGYLGLYFASIGENMKAASEGKKGLDYHEKLIELCPNWGDVYLSKGIFNYYTSDVPWYIKPILWILGKSGTESSAHKYLKLVIEKGRFAKYEALEITAQLYIRQEKADLAFAIIDKLIQEFPENKYYYLFRFGIDLAGKNMLAESDKLIMRGINLSKSETLADFEKLEIGYMYLYLAYFYYEAKEYNKVIGLWKELIGRKIVPGFDSWGHIVLGNAYLEIGNKTEAREYYNWVLKNSNIDNHKTIAKEKLSKL